MNWWIFASGLLSLTTAAVHVFLGGPEVHLPVQANDGLTLEVRAVMAVVWHGISAILILSGVAKIYSACTGQIRSAIAFIAAQYLALAALFIGYGAIRFGSLLVIPQWTLFVVILATLGLGLRRRRAPSRVAAPAEVDRMML